MTCLAKRILIFNLVCLTHIIAFAQPVPTAQSLYRQGESIIHKSPEQAYSLIKKAMNRSKENAEWKVYAMAVNKLAVLSLDGKAEQRKEVLAWAKEATEILKNANDSSLAELHYNLGVLSSSEYEIDAAVFHFEQAKKIWILLYGELNEQVAGCYHGLGDIYKYYTFDFREAEKCYEKALQIREKIKFQDNTVLYRNYYSLAATNRSQHDFEKALSYGSKTLELARKLNNSIKIEESNGMVANIYRDVGESALARSHYLEAIAINRKTNNLENRAWYFASMGELLKNDSLYDEALQYFLLSYALYTSNDLSRLLFINLLINMIDTYAHKGDDANFLKTTTEVFKALRRLDKLHSKEAYTVFLMLGDHQSAQARYDSALLYYQKALVAVVPLFQSLEPANNPTEGMVGFVYYIYEGLAKKAAALKAKYVDTKDPVYLEQSIDCLILSEKLLSQERNTLDMEDAKWKFLDSNYDLYETILSSLFAGYNVLPEDTLNQLAFRYFEQSKSRSLSDALTQAEQRSQISNEDSLLRVLADLKRKLFKAQHEINQHTEKGLDAKEIPGLRDEIVGIDRGILACKGEIEKRYPGYFNAKYGYRTPALHNVQQIISQRKQVMLEYFWGDEWVYAFGIRGDEISFQRIGRPDSINAIVNAVLMHFVGEHSSMSEEVFHQFTRNAYRLYQILVAPFGTLIRDNGRIQIIPDGPIAQVPFEILLEANPTRRQVDYRSLKYLVKSHTIGYAYSSPMLLHTSKRMVHKPSVLAVGFTGGQRVRAADPEFEDIAGAEQELEALEKRFTTGTFLRGKDATEANFKMLSPDFDIIHLAIHGKGDTQENFSASLYFGSRYDSLDDGELHAYELYGLKLKALMAVLSACESGLGKGYRGEGMISMASAFTYSGCENILMSLWKVNDQASTVLMNDFYGQLQKGETIDKALRLAKLNYLETADELTADPKIWAPLVAYGSLDRVFQKDWSTYYLSFAIIMVLALLLTFSYRKRIF